MLFSFCSGAILGFSVKDFQFTTEVMGGRRRGWAKDFAEEPDLRNWGAVLMIPFELIGATNMGLYVASCAKSTSPGQILNPKQQNHSTLFFAANRKEGEDTEAAVLWTLTPTHSKRVPQVHFIPGGGEPKSSPEADPKPLAETTPKSLPEEEQKWMRDEVYFLYDGMLARTPRLVDGELNNHPNSNFLLNLLLSTYTHIHSQFVIATWFCDWHLQLPHLWLFYDCLWSAIIVITNTG